MLDNSQCLVDDRLNFSALIRSACEERFKKYVDRTDVVVESVERAKSPTYGFWLAMILIVGAGFKLILKVHFNSRAVQLMGSKYLNDNADSEIIADFVREYCNVTAGFVKELFGKAELKVGVSLPLVISGFDDVFFQYRNDENCVHHFWAFKYRDQKIVCSFTFDSLEAGVFEKFKGMSIDTLKNTEEQDSNAVEFL